MSIRLTRAWLPDPELVNLPADRTIPGVSSSPHLGELYRAIPVERLNELIIVDEDLTLQELYTGLVSFYSPATNPALLYTYATKAGEPVVEVVINALYLGHHYGAATGPLLNVVKTLQESPLTAITQFPTKEQIDKFLDTKLWFANESFQVPADFVWEVSQNWDREQITKVLTLENGVINRIINYAISGLNPDQIEEQITGVSTVPQSWLDAVLEGILSEENEEEDVF